MNQANAVENLKFLENSVCVLQQAFFPLKTLEEVKKVLFS